ncbi:rRNA maturation RNase YbeY [Candidatus Gracilibacteria bacterium]|nr:rRNA maturation RNase YbeY [Candidatus Gracilibacteria bacterium]
MFSLQILEKPNFLISQKILDDISRCISDTINKKQSGVVNLVFLDPHSIQNLNKDYRGKDSVTDVLSFHYHDDYSELSEEDLAGEIVFCEEKIISQGVEYGLGTEKEFYKLVIHSVIHLLGYDHESDEQYKEMQALEDKVWRKVFGG